MKIVKGLLTTVGGIAVVGVATTFAVGVVVGASLLGNEQKLKNVVNDLENHLDKKQEDTASKPDGEEEAEKQDNA